MYHDEYHHQNEKKKNVLNEDEKQEQEILLDQLFKYNVLSQKMKD